jgi:hypothetical protein
MKKPLTAEDIWWGGFEDELDEISDLSMAVELIVRDETELHEEEVRALTVLVMHVNNRMKALLSKMRSEGTEERAV